MTTLSVFVVRISINKCLVGAELRGALASSYK